MTPAGRDEDLSWPHRHMRWTARTGDTVPAEKRFFSVFGSIFCIVLSMAIGFSNVFYVAAGVYVVGLLFMKTSTDAEGGQTSASADQPPLPGA